MMAVNLADDFGLNTDDKENDETVMEPKILTPARSGNENDESGDDDAPAEKRKKRGRKPKAKPEGDKIKKTDDDVASLMKQLEEAKAEQNALRQQSKKLEETLELEIALRESLAKENSELRGLSEALEITKSKLHEVETGYGELLEQLACSEAEPNTLKKITPQGLILCDKVTRPIAMALNKNIINWKIETTTLLKLTEKVPETLKFADFDLVLVMVGSVDILEGSTGLKAYAAFKTLIEGICKHTKVACLELPPTNVRKMSGHINLFNMKLATADIDCQHLKLNLTSLKSSLLEDDGSSLKTSCVESISAMIDDSLTIPEPKKKCREEEDKTFFTKVFVEIPKGNMGKVIGRQGNVIKAITDKHDVKIATGRWSEGRGDSGPHTEAVVIVGALDNIKKASIDIDNIVNN
jgi:hypothetical protein